MPSRPTEIETEDVLDVPPGNGAIHAGLRVMAHAVSGGTYLDLGTYEEISELDASLREA